MREVHLRRAAVPGAQTQAHRRHEQEQINRSAEQAAAARLRQESLKKRFGRTGHESNRDSCCIAVVRFTRGSHTGRVVTQCSARSGSVATSRIATRFVRFPSRVGRGRWCCRLRRVSLHGSVKLRKAFSAAVCASYASPSSC